MSSARRAQAAFIQNVAHLGYPRITAYGVELMRRLGSDGEEPAPTELEISACEGAVGDLPVRANAAHQRLFGRALSILHAAQRLPELVEQLVTESLALANRIAVTGLARVRNRERSRQPAADEEHALQVEAELLEKAWASIDADLRSLANGGDLDELQSGIAQLEAMLRVPMLTVRQQAAFDGIRTVQFWATTQAREAVKTMNEYANAASSGDATEKSEEEAACETHQ